MRPIIFILVVVLSLGLFAQATLDPRYHTYAEIKAEIDSLQELYPDIVMVDSIGTTLGAEPYCEPRPIWAVKISDNVTVDEDEPAVLFVGQCHAEEVLGVEVVMYMINDILEHRFQIPYLYWISEMEIWFVPTYNPEGLEVVMDGRDITYRKNQRDNNLNGIFDFEVGQGGDVDGVDPNRNYSFNWIHGDTLFAPGNEEWNDYYRGPYPFSEGGTQAIRNLAERQHFIFSINYHSSRSGNHAEKVHFSFEWNGGKTCPDFDVTQYVGNHVAELIENEAGTGHYECSPSVSRRGHAHDWFYQTHGTIQLLIECGTMSIQPNNDPPLYLVDDTCERNSEGAYWLLNRAIGYQTDSASMLTGHITDAVTGEPLVAEVIVEEKKASFFAPRLSDELYGRFWRVLNPGTYTLRVRKKGYEEQIIENVIVNNSAWTTLNIQLNPLPEINISGAVTGAGENIPAQIVVFGLENDTIFTQNDGTFEFQNFAGILRILITSSGYVPYFYENVFEEGSHEISIDLQPEIEIFAEDWDEDFSDWIVSGDWGILYDEEAHEYFVTDSPMEFYEDNSNSVLQLNHFVNLMGVNEDVVLSFWQKYHTEHDVDLCKVEVSTDGNNWQELAVFSGVNDYWQRVVLPLSEYMNHYLFLRFRLSADETCNDPGWDIRNIKIVSSVGSVAGEEEIIPVQTALYDNIPNPFGKFTTISFSMSPREAEKAKIEIYNVKGQKVRTLRNFDCSDEKAANSSFHTVWNGRDDNNKAVSSGIYFYKLATDNYNKIKKMLIIK